jgi:hypothetical protein
MKCHRCGTVRVYERFYGLHEYFSGWRCVLCGQIIDQVILENRLARTVGRIEGEGEKGIVDRDLTVGLSLGA